MWYCNCKILQIFVEKWSSLFVMGIFALIRLIPCPILWSNSWLSLSKLLRYKMVNFYLLAPNLLALPPIIFSYHSNIFKGKSINFGSLHFFAKKIINSQELNADIDCVLYCNHEIFTPTGSNICQQLGLCYQRGK